MKYKFKQTNSRHRWLKPVVTFLLFVLSLPQLLFAQEDRINANLPVIGDTALWTLKQATGWMKNAEGQWIEGKNKIQKYKMSVSNKEEWNVGINATGKDNFTFIEARDMKFAGMDFLIIIKHLKDGKFKNPTIYAGWEPLDMVRYYVVKKNDTRPMKYEHEENYKDYEIVTYFLGAILDGKDLLDRIKLAISATDQRVPDLKKFGNATSLRLLYTELSDGKSVRFHFHTKSENPGGNELVDVYPYGGFGEYHNYASHIPIGNFYYECPKENMAGLIDLIQKK